MVKHGSSHGLSVFVCTIISAIIIDLFRPLLPDLYKKFEGISQKILDYIPLNISPKYFNILLIASFLGVLWGIFFKLRFDKDQIKNLMESLAPYILKTGGLGFLTGFIIGYAFKKISKFLVILVGIFLIVTQLMIYNGIIDINWIIIETAAQDAFNQQGWSLNKLKQILLVNLPFAGAAGIGFLLGLKKG